MLGIPAAYLGHAAGLTTSVLWTGTSLAFTAAGRRLGPTLVNAARILMAVVLLALIHRALAGTWVPAATAGEVGFLALSGLVGLSLGDQALFTAFVAIGPRLAMLIMTTAPLMAALFGWIVLRERLGVTSWLGITVTIAGVAWVVMERPAAHSETASRHRLRGMILAFVAAVCQTGGYLLSKLGMGHGWLPEAQHLDPQAATLVRMVFAALGILPILWLHGQRERRQRAAGIRRALVGSRAAGFLLTFCGAVIGPTLGVWMSLVAADKAPLGVAQTLCSLPPVLILPVAHLVHKERITPRAVIGAFVAVGGVALLFLTRG